MFQGYVGKFLDSWFVVRIGFCPFCLQSHFFKSDRSPDVAVASMHKFPRFFSRGNRFPFPIDLINGSKKVNEGLVQSCLDCQLFNKKNSVASGKKGMTKKDSFRINLHEFGNQICT